MKSATKYLILTLILGLLLVPVTGLAQGQVTLDEASIVLWPEYDRPGVLVIYRVKLSSDVPLPTPLEFTIPTAAGEPNAVAEKAIDGNLYNVAYDREVHGDRAVILLTATMPELQIEYYDPSLQVDGTERQFNYTWQGDYPVEHLLFEVQQPLEAENFSIHPTLGGSNVGRDGLRYYGADVGALGEGDTFNLSLDYEKAVDALSVEIGPGLYPQPSSSISQSTPGRVNLNIILRWLAVLFVVLLLVGGIFWLVRIRNASQFAPAPSRTKRGKRSAGGPEQEQPADNGIYCHQCGKRAAPGDMFCRACGTRLRVEEK